MGTRITPNTDTFHEYAINFLSAFYFSISIGHNHLFNLFLSRCVRGSYEHANTKNIQLVTKISFKYSQFGESGLAG